MRRAYVACSFLCFGLAVAIFGSALSIEPTVGKPPTPRTDVRIFARREYKIITATPGPTETAKPTPTTYANCRYTMVQGSVCAWPTPTMVLPVPTCGPDHTPGLLCIIHGPILMSIHGPMTATPVPTGTPTPVYGGQETTAMDQTR